MAKNLVTFSPEFKRDCLAFLLKDNITAKKVVPSLPENLFEFNAEYHVIFTAFRQFVIDFNVRPNRHELYDLLKDRCRDLKLDDEKKKILFRAHEKIWEWSGYTPSYVREKLYDHIQAHNFYLVLRDAEDMIDQGDYEEMIQRLTAARNSVVEEAAVHEYWDGMSERIDRRMKEKVYRIPTNMKPIDDLISGGLPRGNLAMLMAGSGYGKSALLGQLALEASLQGYTVAYVTLELAAEEVMKRNDSSNTGIPVSSLGVAKPRRVKKQLFDLYKSQQVIGKQPGPYYVQYYPTKTVGIPDIEAFVERLRDEYGVTLDLLVLDYFDLMKMTGSYTKKYEALEENCEILRGLAGTYDMAIWTASQVNRGGIGEETVDMDNISGSFGKVFPLDLLLTISQTKQEKTKKVFRLHIAKSRLGPTHESVFVEPDFDRMRFTALTADEAKRKGLYANSKSQGGNQKQKPLTGQFGTQGP